jgi:hypothetical protein
MCILMVRAVYKRQCEIAVILSLAPPKKDIPNFITLKENDIMAIEAFTNEQCNQLIADLLKWVTGKTPVEIRFEDDDDDQWSVTTLYDYGGDKELSLRLHVNDVYDVHLGYYDDDDEFIEIIEPLSVEQKKALPEKLKKVMKKVLDDEKGIRLPGSLLA